jgi:hypothetical protein
VGGDVVLTILEGTVAEISDSALLLEPATRIMLPPGCVTDPVRVGARVLVRARRIRGQYVAESVTVRPAAQKARCPARRTRSRDLRAHSRLHPRPVLPEGAPDWPGTERRLDPGDLALGAHD